MKFVPKKKVIPLPKWRLEDGVTQSMLNEFLACRERARLAYVDGWSTIGTSNAITFGSLFHGCLENLYKHMRMGGEINGPQYVPNVVGVELNKFKEEIKKERLWTPVDEENHILNEGYLKILVPEYVKLYWKKDKESKWLLVEDEFKNPIQLSNGETIRMRGKFDRVAEKNGEVWIYETKTKYAFDPEIQNRLSYDLQVMVYTLNYETQYKQLPKGFIYDMIQRPRLRRGANETLKHFMERLKNDVDESYFKRIRMNIDPNEFRKWQANDLTPILLEFKAWALKQLPTYRNPASCETRYGVCKFSKICGLKDYTGLFQRKELFPELTIKEVSL